VDSPLESPEKKDAGEEESIRVQDVSKRSLTGEVNAAWEKGGGYQEERSSSTRRVLQTLRFPEKRGPQIKTRVLVMKKKDRRFKSAFALGEKG